VGLKRGPLSLASTIEELLGRNSRGSGLSTKVGTNFADKRRSVGIVRLRAKATDFV
jgi:hypothetical protein